MSTQIIVINGTKYEISARDIEAIQHAQHCYRRDVKPLQIISDTQTDTPNDTLPDTPNNLDDSVDFSNEHIHEMRSYEPIETGDFNIERFRISDVMRKNIKEFYDEVKKMRYFDWYENAEHFMSKYNITLFEFMSIRQYVYNEKITMTMTKKNYFLSDVVKFTVDGVLHREDGYAYIENGGEVALCFRNGLIHSYGDKPAYATPHGIYVYAKHGKFYREGGKPIIYDRALSVVSIDGKLRWVDDNNRIIRDFDKTDNVALYYHI
jgi:hypothetical protein